MKRYFRNDKSDEYCYTMATIKKMMKFRGCKEQKLFEAKMMVGFEYFWCREFLEVGEVGEGCGRDCKEYSPRNGKSGRCKHSANLYEPTSKEVIVKIQ